MISVVLPYGMRTEWEHRLFEYVSLFWAAVPGAEVIIGESPEPFNRSSARNNGAREAGGEILVHCDADTVLIHDGGPEALVEGLAPGQWILPELYVQANQKWTEAVLDGHPLSRPGPGGVDRIYAGEPGGFRVCWAKDYWQVGGFDEGFSGWGYEDTAFALTMDTLVSQAVRRGTALHLWHPKNRSQRQGQPLISTNKWRYGLYASAARKGPAYLAGLLRDLKVVG